jgi:thiamine biosynthesis lipoprotein
MKKIFYSLILAIITLSCAPSKPAQFKKVFMRMDTVVEVTLVAPKNAKLEVTWTTLDSLLLYFENHFSPEIKTSEVHAVNYREHDTISVSPLLMDMIDRALVLADILKGYFDITIYPLKTIWGLSSASKDQRVPTSTELQAVMQHVGYKKVLAHPQEGTISFTDSQVKIDIGGIAKSEALWAIASLLDSQKYPDYLISAGGDIICHGKRDDGKLWRIGVQHPRIPGKLVAVFNLDSGSIVTSGDYERFWFTPDSVRIHHIFNPFTGESCRRNQSVTLWCKDPKAAYIPSAGMFCREPEDIIAFCKDRPNFECMIIDSTGEIFVSPRWKDKIEIQ